MQSSDWEAAWYKQYNNRSDDRWKTKSLNPMPMEQYLIPLEKKTPKPPQPKPGQQGKDTKKEKVQPPKEVKQQLPNPKMSKINENIFCISLDCQIHLFYLITSNEQKAKMKVKKLFGMITIPMQEKIEFVTGNNSNLIIAGTKNNMVILEIIKYDYRYEVKKKLVKSIPDLRTIITLGNRLLAVSATHIVQFDTANTLQEISTISTKKIEFSMKQQEAIFKQLNPVGIVIGSGHSLFYFGSMIQEKVDISKLKGAPGEMQKRVKSEALTIVKLKIEGTSQVEGVKARLYPVDHIFELGIFTRSKIYEIESETFLVSLHEEVILIKQNFDKYIVWDNVSVVSSKSQSKKGQLILADKKILVYSQNAEIYAHEIYFNQQDSKLNMPPIDNFKGNDNDEQILYDALLLEYEDSIMKVLAYIKPSLVVYPTNESNFKKIETDPSKMKEEPTHLDFTIICISQSDPKRKLEQLIEKGKTNQQIEAFCIRFNISKQQETKCRWNVSEKKLKDIQNILMEIQDDKYIQTELDNILKKESHNLDFLNAVEIKQISRLKRLLVNKICEYSSTDSKEEAKRLLEYINDIIQWLMESIMFKEKVNYSKNFLSFKQYDFIEIGKLKAASLKEEIKLLSCKKYEKRLKYFLNSFKILVISNYNEVFNFLLINKSCQEIQEFILQFRFILPQFQEPSSVFIGGKKFNIFDKNKMRENTPKNKRGRLLSFNAQNDDFQVPSQFGREKSKEKESNRDLQKDKEKEERCILWDPLDENKQITQTMQVFQLMILKQIEMNLSQQNARQKAINKFKQILSRFKSSSWFVNAAFKQHSMITKTTKEIYEEFKQLKRKGAFKILVQFLYHKISELSKIQKTKGEDFQWSMNSMLEKFIQEGLIPESFKKNVDARVVVYRSLLQKKNASEVKKMMLIELPFLENFVVMKEDEYFDFLFRNIRNKILKEVKDIYDGIEPGFFRERFQIFLKSNLLKPDDIINFLDEFSEDIQADDIRIDVFATIKRLLKLADRVNTKCYIEKSMDKEVLPERQDIQTGKLRQEAKIPYGYYFYHFFLVFHLDYTYEEFINYSNIPMIKGNKVIQELVSKYCKGEYELHENYSGNLACEVQFEQVGIHEKIDNVDIHNQPLQFFGLMLHMLDVMDFQIQEKDVFQLIMQCYLNEQKFKQLTDLIQKLREYHMPNYEMHSKNYQMINDFKEQVDVDKLFIDYVIEWVKRTYNSIKNPAELDDKLSSVDRAITMVNSFTRNLSSIRKEKALFEMLMNIKWFDPTLILNVEQIKQEAMNHSSFIFIMHIFKRIGLEKFTSSGSMQSEPIKIENLFRIFQSHKQYIHLEKVDYSHPEFMRFLIEICIVMIENNNFPMAKYLMLVKIPNDQHYFYDVLLYFLAAAHRQERRAKQYKDDIIKQILTPETSNLIKNNLSTIIEKYNITKFIFAAKNTRNENKSDGELIPKLVEKMEDRAEVNRRFLQMFDLVMSRHRRDDGFFFLVRAKIVTNDSIVDIARKYKPFGNDQTERMRQNIEFQSYFLIVSYLKVLQTFIQKQFYPTYTFYKCKFEILQDPKERKDMIKDVNIAISKLQKMYIKNESMRPIIDEPRKELQNYYNEYMKEIGEDPDIKLVDDSNREGARKVDMYSRRLTKDIFQEESMQEAEIKRDLQRNTEKMNQLNEDNRLNVLNREVSERITQIKKQNERHALLEAETKKQEKPMNLAERKARQIEEIKRKEKEDIDSIKDSYKSNTTKRVNELIETLRKKREAIQAKRMAPTSAVRDEPKESGVISRPPPIVPPSRNNMRNLIDNYMTVQSPRTQSISENVYPITMKTKAERVGQKQEKPAQNKFQLLDLQRKMFPEPQMPGLKKKVVFDDIVALYKANESMQALKCIQKYDMLKNPHVRVQLIKQAFSVTSNIQNFIQFLKFLIAVDPTWKESIQEKSITIATQMIKLKDKEKDQIKVKSFIPAELFTTINKVNMKDYYSIAFDILKPNMKKIFEKEQMAVHAVGILFRYTLGSENRFYSKVFYEYFKVILKNYEMKNYDDKELTILAEKIRSNYSSLPDNKDQVLEQLLNGIGSQSKRTRLLEALKRTVERKGQSLVGGAANREIVYVLQKMMK